MENRTSVQSLNSFASNIYVYSKKQAVGFFMCVSWNLDDDTVRWQRDVAMIFWLAGLVSHLSSIMGKPAVGQN